MAPSPSARHSNRTPPAPTPSRRSSAASKPLCAIGIAPSPSCAAFRKNVPRSRPASPRTFRLELALFRRLTLCPAARPSPAQLRGPPPIGRRKPRVGWVPNPLPGAFRRWGGHANGKRVASDTTALELQSDAEIHLSRAGLGNQNTRLAANRSDRTGADIRIRLGEAGMVERVGHGEI